MFSIECYEIKLNVPEIQKHFFFVIYITKLISLHYLLTFGFQNTGQQSSLQSLQNYLLTSAVAISIKFWMAVSTLALFFVATSAIFCSKIARMSFGFGLSSLSNFSAVRKASCSLSARSAAALNEI